MDSPTRGARLAAGCAFALFVAFTVAACGGKDHGPTSIESPPVLPPTIASVNAQVFDGALNTPLDVFPAVTLKDAGGSAVSGAWVRFTPSTGKVENDSALTDASGRASAGRWTIGTTAGLQKVTASARGVSVVALSANIAPGPMVGIVPASPTIAGVAGGTVTTPPSAKAVDSYGNGVPRVFVQFAVWNGDGTITGSTQTTDDNGIATVGSWTLGPKAGAQSLRVDDHRTGATTLLNAIASPAPASRLVIVDGNAQTGQAGRRLCTSPSVAVLDAYGNGVGGVPVVFAPGAGSGTVTGGSVVTDAGTGYASVGTWTLAASASQTLTVTSAAVPGVSATINATVGPTAAYSVCVRYVGSGATARVRQAVTTAVERWQRVIVAHVATSAIAETANRCFAGEPALNESVEDLLVFVQVTQLDGPGNSAARAGPCTVHFPSGLTQMGLLQLDSADVDGLVAQGVFDGMVAHEFGHVLGFGTLWTSKALLSGSGTVDPVFTGAGARAQFAALYPIYAGATVPVENSGDVGTRESHWRRGVFNNELMQGFSSATMPMSRVTVAALGDLGYAVDVSKADPFAFGVVAGVRAVRIANDIYWGQLRQSDRLR